MSFTSMISWPRALLLGAAVLATSALADDQVKPIDEVFEPTGDYPADEYMKIATVQWAPGMSSPVGVTPAAAEQVKARNRRDAARYVTEAIEAGANWILLPEFAVVGYPDIPELPDEEDNFRNRDDIQPYVEKIPGKTTDFFAKIARDNKVWINVGVAEVDPVTNDYHNSIAVIDDTGTIRAVHRKVHLFDIEVNYLVPGKVATTFESPIGKVGLAVCSDIYDDFMLDSFKADKVRAIALSTSWASYNTGWSAFTRAAKYVKSYLFAANQNFFPDSGVINADGSAQSHIRQTTGVAYGYVSYE